MCSEDILCLVYSSRLSQGQREAIMSLFATILFGLLPLALVLLFSDEENLREEKEYESVDAESSGNLEYNDEQNGDSMKGKQRRTQGESSSSNLGRSKRSAEDQDEENSKRDQKASRDSVISSLKWDPGSSIASSSGQEQESSINPSSREDQGSRAASSISSNSVLGSSSKSSKRIVINKSSTRNSFSDVREVEYSKRGQRASEDSGLGIASSSRREQANSITPSSRKDQGSRDASLISFKLEPHSSLKTSRTFERKKSDARKIDSEDRDIWFSKRGQRANEHSGFSSLKGGLKRSDHSTTYPNKKSEAERKGSSHISWKGTVENIHPKSSKFRPSSKGKSSSNDYSKTGATGQSVNYSNSSPPLGSSPFSNQRSRNPISVASYVKGKGKTSKTLTDQIDSPESLTRGRSSVNLLKGQERDVSDRYIHPVKGDGDRTESENISGTENNKIEVSSNPFVTERKPRHETALRLSSSKEQENAVFCQKTDEFGHCRVRTFIENTNPFHREINEGKLSCKEIDPIEKSDRTARSKHVGHSEPISNPFIIPTDSNCMPGSSSRERKPRTGSESNVKNVFCSNPFIEQQEVSCGSKRSCTELEKVVDHKQRQSYSELEANHEQSTSSTEHKLEAKNEQIISSTEHKLEAQNEQSTSSIEHKLEAKNEQRISSTEHKLEAKNEQRISSTEHKLEAKNEQRISSTEHKLEAKNEQSTPSTEHKLEAKNEQSTPSTEQEMSHDEQRKRFTEHIQVTSHEQMASSAEEKQETYNKQGESFIQQPGANHKQSESSTEQEKEVHYEQSNTTIGHEKGRNHEPRTSATEQKGEAQLQGKCYTEHEQEGNQEYRKTGIELEQENVLLSQKTNFSEINYLSGCREHFIVEQNKPNNHPHATDSKGDNHNHKFKNVSTYCLPIHDSSIKNMSIIETKLKAKIRSVEKHTFSEETPHRRHNSGKSSSEDNEEGNSDSDIPSSEIWADKQPTRVSEGLEPTPQISIVCSSLEEKTLAIGEESRLSFLQQRQKTQFTGSCISVIPTPNSETTCLSSMKKEVETCQVPMLCSINEKSESEFGRLYTKDSNLEKSTISANESIFSLSKTQTPFTDELKGVQEGNALYSCEDEEKQGKENQGNPVLACLQTQFQTKESNDSSSSTTFLQTSSQTSYLGSSVNETGTCRTQMVNPSLETSEYGVRPLLETDSIGKIEETISRNESIVYQTESEISVSNFEENNLETVIGAGNEERVPSYILLSSHLNNDDSSHTLQSYQNTLKVSDLSPPYPFRHPSYQSRLQKECNGELFLLHSNQDRERSNLSPAHQDSKSSYQSPSLRGCTPPHRSLLHQDLNQLDLSSSNKNDIQCYPSPSHLGHKIYYTSPSYRERASSPLSTQYKNNNEPSQQLPSYQDYKPSQLSPAYQDNKPCYPLPSYPYYKLCYLSPPSPDNESFYISPSHQSNKPHKTCSSCEIKKSSIPLSPPLTKLGASKMKKTKKRCKDTSYNSYSEPRPPGVKFGIGESNFGIPSTSQSQTLFSDLFTETEGSTSAHEVKTPMPFYSILISNRNDQNHQEDEENDCVSREKLGFFFETKTNDAEEQMPKIWISNNDLDYPQTQTDENCDDDDDLSIKCRPTMPINESSLTDVFSETTDRSAARQGKTFIILH